MYAHTLVYEYYSHVLLNPHLNLPSSVEGFKLFLYLETVKDSRTLCDADVRYHVHTSYPPHTTRTQHSAEYCTRLVRKALSKSVHTIPDLVLSSTTSPDAVFFPLPIAPVQLYTTWVIDLAYVIAMVTPPSYREGKPRSHACSAVQCVVRTCWLRDHTMSSVLGCASLGASTFCAQQHGAEECDNKGLPLTPNSINIVGRFQALLELDHPGLCAYLDIIRTRNGEHVLLEPYLDTYASF